MQVVRQYSGGSPYQQAVLSSSDTAQQLPIAYRRIDGLDSGKKAKSVLITIESNSIRFSFHTSPTTSLGHEARSGDTVYLESEAEVDRFKFISKTAGTVATLQVTSYF